MQKIIDAHLHLVEHEEYFDRIAIAAGHENSERHLHKIYRDLGITQGIVMGNKTLALKDHHYPEYLSYCIGLDKVGWNVLDLSLIEKHLQRRQCVGIKLYPGYQHFFVYDDSLEPLYKLARRFDSPIAVHTGFTAQHDHKVSKYCEPIVMARAAERFPENRFVMCHFGEPMFHEAAEVMRKFSNISTDLSGILVGKMSRSSFDTSYIERLQTSLHSIGDWDRIMFGTDFPLANIKNYIEFTKLVVPSTEWEKVFHANATRIYKLEGL